MVSLIGSLFCLVLGHQDPVTKFFGREYRYGLCPRCLRHVVCKAGTWRTISVKEIMKDVAPDK